MSKILNPFTVTSALPVITSEKENGMWVTGTLNIEKEHLIPNPDSFSIFITDDYEEDLVGKTINLMDEGNRLFMLPDGHESGLFLGSDINSGVVFYGDTTVVNDLKIKLEEMFLSRIPYMSFIDFESSGFAFMVWTLADNKSMLILYNDTMYGIELPKEIRNLPLIAVTMGGDADDLTAIEVLMPLVYPHIKDSKVKKEFHEDFIENVQDNFSTDYISFLGKKPNKKNELKGVAVNDIINLAHLLMCDYLQLHLAKKVEYLTKDDLEFACRVNKIKQNSK